MSASSAWLRTAATSIRTALTAAALTLLVVLGAMSVIAPPPTPPADHLGLSGEDRGTDRMLDRNRCSTTGFQPEVTPESAVIRDRQGRTRLVSFDHAWDVFNHDKPGELVAVCLGRLPTAKGLTR